jgi:SAM-dependent methyltransferase
MTSPRPAPQVQDLAADSRSGSTDRFGYQWNYYDELRPDYEVQFLGWTSPLGRDDWKGKRFLDAGCGMGRNSHWPMTYGASGGAAIDVDERTLEAAKRTLSRWPQIEVRRASIYELPWREEFDICFSIGVFHHLENPERAMASLVAATKPAGKILIWAYGRENAATLVYVLNPLRKLLFSQLPIRLVHALSWIPTACLWLGLRVGLGRIAYLKLISRFSFSHLRLIVFDQMLPRIAHYWTREEVERLMRGAGLDDVRLVWVNEISWTAIGTKPAP